MEWFGKPHRTESEGKGRWFSQWELSVWTEKKTHSPCWFNDPSMRYEEIQRWQQETFPSPVTVLWTPWKWDLAKGFIASLRAFCTLLSYALHSVSHTTPESSSQGLPKKFPLEFQLFKHNWPWMGCQSVGRVPSCSRISLPMKIALETHPLTSLSYSIQLSGS